MNYKPKLKYETKIPFFLIWKYLRRGNKWTFFFTIFLMSVAFINLIFVTSLFNGIIKGSNDQLINVFIGNVSITSANGKDFIDNSSNVVSEIDKNSNVSGVSDQLSLPGTIKYKNIKGGWQIVAINPDKEKGVTNVSEKMIEGSYLDKNDTDKIIIGKQIAGGKDVELDNFSLKDVHVGDKVNVIIQGVSKDFTVKGIFFTNFAQQDMRAFITQKEIAQILPPLQNKANYIIIKTKKTGDESEVISQLKDAGIQGNFHNWEDSAGMIKSITKSFASVDFLLTTVAIIIAAVTIFIVIYVDVSNKKRQIGILRAIGIRPYLICTAYVLQTVIYSFLGVLLGVVIFFAAIVPYFKAYPFHLPIADVVLVVNSFDFIIRTETIIWVAIFAGLIPAIMVTRIKILDAILGK